MDPLLIGQVGLLLGTVGAGLQYLRALKGFPEWGYYTLAGVCTLGGCWLALSGPVTDWRMFLLANWPIAVTLYSTTLGGTQAASSGAKAVVNRGANPDHPLVPVTNSK